MNCFTFTCFQQGSTACVGKKARSLCLTWTSITHLKFVINDVLHGYGSDEHPSFTLDPLLLNYEEGRDGEMVERKKKLHLGKASWIKRERFQRILFADCLIRRTYVSPVLGR